MPTNSSPPPYLSLLPIEVHATQFRNTARYSFKKGLNFTVLLPHIKNLLIKTKKTTLEIPTLPEEKRETHYIESVKSLQIIRKWIEFLIQVYKESKKLTELTSQDEADLAPLYALEQEIQELLNKELSSILEKRKTSHSDMAETFKQAVATMQKKTEQLTRKIALVYKIVDPMTYSYAEQLIVHFFADFMLLSEKITTFIETHLQEWTTLTLREGRDLLIQNPEGLPCSFLFSVEGNCYTLVESVEHLLGKGSDKIVFRAIALPQGTIKAIIKPSAAKELIEEEKKTSRQKSQLFNMWTESELLIRLKGSLGVIQVDERMVFEIEEKKQLFLIEEYYWDGSLHDYFSYTLKNRHNPELFSQEKNHKIMEQTLGGLIAIHKAGIIHHDIKPDNILLDDSEEEIKAAIADFQLASYLHDQRRLDYLRCRAAWASPEYAHVKLSESPKKHYAAIGNKPLDIWSLGIVFYILVTHSFPPWIQKSKSKPKKEKKGSASVKQTPKTDEEKDKESTTDEDEKMVFQQVADLQSDWIPEEARNSPYFPLLEKMLDIDPAKRCSAEEALEILSKITH